MPYDEVRSCSDHKHKYMQRLTRSLVFAEKDNDKAILEAHAAQVSEALRACESSLQFILEGVGREWHLMHPSYAMLSHLFQRTNSCCDS